MGVEKKVIYKFIIFFYVQQLSYFTLIDHVWFIDVIVGCL